MSIKYIHEFFNKEIRIQCETKDEALELFKWLTSKGVIWKNGCSLEKNTYWEEYKELTTYQIDYVPTKFANLKHKAELSFWSALKYISIPQSTMEMPTVKYKDIPKELFSLDETIQEVLKMNR